MADKVTKSSAAHPLSCGWQFWFVGKVTSTKSEDYESRMKPIGPLMTTVEEFWRNYAFLMRAHELPAFCDIYMFRQGIKPAWEDAGNKDGGKFNAKVKKASSTKIWEDLVMAVIGDDFGTDLSQVNGIGVCGRYNENNVSLWNKDASDVQSKEKIEQRLKQILGEYTMDFKAHATALQEAKSIATMQQTQHTQPQSGQEKDGEDTAVVSANPFESLEENEAERANGEKAAQKPREDAAPQDPNTPKKYVPPQRNPETQHDPSFRTFHKGPHRGGYQKNFSPRPEREGGNGEFSTYQRGKGRYGSKPNYQKDSTSQLSSSPS